MKSVVSVLTTVNAPYSEKLVGETLALCLKDISAAKLKPGHMSSFYGEVSLKAQKAFAAYFDIPEVDLIAATKAFANYSGESYSLVA